MSSITTSDTEAGLPGVRLRELRFSLYSTDTEEQVASVNRGLDRCAALLTSLLAPDNTTELLPQQPKALVVSKEQLNGAEQIHRHGNVEKGKSLSSKLKTQTDGSSRPPEIRTTDCPPSEGGHMRSHPHASSTPIPQRDRRNSELNAKSRGSKPTNEVPNAVQSKPTRVVKPKKFDGEYSLPRKPLTSNATTRIQTLDKTSRPKVTGENVTKMNAPKSRKRLQIPSGKPFNTLNRKQRNLVNGAPSRVPAISSVASSRHSDSTAKPVTTTVIVHSNLTEDAHSKSQPRPPSPKLVSNLPPHPPFDYPFLLTYPYFSPHPPPSTTPVSWPSISALCPSNSVPCPLNFAPWSRQLPSDGKLGTNEEAVLPPRPYPAPLINGWYPLHHQQFNTDKLKGSSSLHTLAPTLSADQHKDTRSTSGPPITVPSHCHSHTPLSPSNATSTTAGAPKTFASEDHTVPTMSSGIHPPGVYTATGSSVHQPFPGLQSANGRPNTGKGIPNRGQKLAKDTQKRCKSAPPSKVSHGDDRNERSSPGKMEILDEMQVSILESVILMKQACKEAGHSVLEGMVVHLENTLNAFCSQLHQESQRSPKHCFFPSRFLSHSHMLEELQLLENEKSQLLQRIVASESAYSAAMGELEQVRKEKSSFHNQVDAHRQELNSLRDDLQNAKDLLTLMNSQSAITKEEFNEMKALATTNCDKVEAENESLKNQAQSLETELARSKQGCLHFTGQLSVLKSAVDSAREELQLIRDTIIEKDTQLVYYQDQLLGLRQCLAYFLSKLRQVGSCKSCDCHMFDDVQYHVPADIVKELQFLVDDGNVEKFIAGQHKHNPTQPDPNKSRRSSIDGQSTTDSDSTLIESETRKVQKSEHDQRDKLNLSCDQAPTSSSASNSVITPLDISGLENYSTPHRAHTMNGSKKGVMNSGKNGVDGSHPVDDCIPSSTGSHSFSSLSQISSTPGQVVSKSVRQQTLKTNSKREDHFQQLLPATEAGVLYGGALSPQTSVTSRGIDVQSSVTTSSEMEFRKDLESLDADIARLQIQFRVALQTSSQYT